MCECCRPAPQAEAFLMLCPGEEFMATLMTRGLFYEFRVKMGAKSSSRANTERATGNSSRRTDALTHSVTGEDLIFNR